MVHDAVDDGGGHLVVPEDPSPAGELEVGRDDDALPLVGVGEHLEDEARAVGVERQESQLVDHEQARAGDLRHLAVEPALLAGAAQPHHERGRREEPGFEPAVARELAQRARHVRLARAHVAHQHQVLAAVEEGQ